MEWPLAREDQSIKMIRRGVCLSPSTANSPASIHICQAGRTKRNVKLSKKHGWTNGEIFCDLTYRNQPQLSCVATSTSLTPRMTFGIQKATQSPAGFFHMSVSGALNCSTMAGMMSFDNTSAKVRKFARGCPIVVKLVSKIEVGGSITSCSMMQQPNVSNQSGSNDKAVLMCRIMLRSFST